MTDSERLDFATPLPIYRGASARPRFGQPARAGCCAGVALRSRPN